MDHLYRGILHLIQYPGTGEVLCSLPKPFVPRRDDSEEIPQQGSIGWQLVFWQSAQRHFKQV